MEPLPIERKLFEIAQDRERELTRELKECNWNDTGRWNRIAEQLREARRDLAERRNRLLRGTQ